MTSTISPETKWPSTPIRLAPRGADHPHATFPTTPMQYSRAGAQTTDSQIRHVLQWLVAVGAISPAGQSWSGVHATGARGGPGSPEPTSGSIPTVEAAQGADSLTDPGPVDIHHSRVGEAQTPPATTPVSSSIGAASLADQINPDASASATPTPGSRPGLVHPTDHLVIDIQKLDVCGVSS